MTGKKYNELCQNAIASYDAISQKEWKELINHIKKNNQSDV